MGWDGSLIIFQTPPNLDADAGSGDDTAKNQDLKDISVDKREASLMGQQLSSVFSPCKRFYIFQLCADFFQLCADFFQLCADF